jgi:hypothetical protein
MNTTEISALTVLVLMLIIFRLVLRVSKSRAAGNPSASVRLSRVRNASLVFFTLMCIGMILSVYWIFGFILSWPFFAEDHIRIVVSHSHIYSSRAEMPPEIFWPWIVKQVFAFFAGVVMLFLFWLYGKGILFTTKNVWCLRFLGYYCIINWFVDYQMQSYLKDMDLSTTPVFVGFFIIFFAWIMDEGRKIQEEQELTV